MNGLELLKKLGERKHHIPVLFLSAYRDFDYAREAVRLGARDYLLKPAETADILQAVLRCLDQGRETKAASSIPDLVPGGIGSIGDRMVLRALEVIRDLGPREAGLEVVASELRMTPSHLSRLFKTGCGMAFARYLAAFRMESAKVLLADPTLKCYEAADRVGYRDVRHFVKAFKVYTGRTPGEYRKHGEIPGDANRTELKQAPASPDFGHRMRDADD